MNSRYRLFVACVLGATLLAPAAARAEKVFPVNDNNTGVFDQPSVAMNGAVANVAFIGSTPGPGYRVYYAAVNGGVDFSNLVLPRDSTVIPIPPTTVDNDVFPNDAYADARHPKIALRSASEVVILFQAKPALTDNVYRLYVARLTLAGTTVVQKSVKQVQNLGAGTLEDVSWALIAADGTARAVYSSRSAITASDEPFELFFARIGLDNAIASPPIAMTASYPSSIGLRPVPNLKIDDLNREHIAWAAGDTSGSAAGPVYYAMLKETNGVDNMVIAPTKIMSRYSAGYSFPSVLVVNHSLITVFAADEAHGDLSYVMVNPDAAWQNGLPGLDNVPNNGLFLLLPPGEAILPPEFRIFRPETIFEPSSGRIFMTGYGAGDQRGATFLAFKLNPAAASADLVSVPAQFALAEPPASIDNDYTLAPFGFPGGKVVVFWSGLLAGGNQNIDVTTIPTVAAFISTSESGCTIVATPSRGAAGRIPGALLLFLPAAALGARRLVVNRGRRRPCGDAGRTIGR